MMICKEVRMENLYKKLMQLQIGPVLFNEPLANHTTLKVGGPATIFVEPSSIESLEKTMQAIREHQVNWRVIGRGSNLLVSDEGIDGVVIKLGTGLSHLQINETVVRVGAGHSIISLAMQMSKHGLSGLEFAAGIPGSVGGAVYMNAGAHGADISRILTKAHVLFSDGTMRWLSKDEMDFSYRTSILQKKRGIVLEAAFQLEKGDKEKSGALMKSNKAYRKETQPWDAPCAGSVFRNPLPNYAGKLIEDAGLKGFSIGGAQVSTKHGNFIINKGNATATDVLQLIDAIKQKILIEYHIRLETEIEIIVRK